MLKRILRINLLVGLALVSDQVLAEKTSQLRITTVVPERPCRFPDPCPTIRTVSQTKVIVSNDGEIRYVGTTPTIKEKDGVLIVIF